MGGLQTQPMLLPFALVNLSTLQELTLRFTTLPPESWPPRALESLGGLRRLLIVNSRLTESELTPPWLFSASLQEL